MIKPILISIVILMATALFYLLAERTNFIRCLFGNCTKLELIAISLTVVLIVVLAVIGIVMAFTYFLPVLLWTIGILAATALFCWYGFIYEPQPKPILERNYPHKIDVPRLDN